MLILHLGAFLGSTLWGWFVTKHPLNKDPISLTSEIMCSYMRVFTVIPNCNGFEAQKRQT